MNSSPKPNRRWYQFSLRALLIVMFVSCMVFAWIGVRLQRARENRDRVTAVEAAVAAIENLGGVVKSEYEKMRPQSWLEKQFDDPGGADDPVSVLHFTKVQLVATQVAGEAMAHLKWLADLKQLYNIYGKNLSPMLALST